MKRIEIKRKCALIFEDISEKKSHFCVIAVLCIKLLKELFSFFLYPIILGSCRQRMEICKIEIMDGILRWRVYITTTFQSHYITKSDILLFKRYKTGYLPYMSTDCRSVSKTAFSTYSQSKLCIYYRNVYFLLFLTAYFSSNILAI